MRYKLQSTILNMKFALLLLAFFAGTAVQAVVTVSNVAASGRKLSSLTSPTMWPAM